MIGRRSRLALIVCILVVYTVLVAISSASLVLWIVGDWEAHRWALTLTLKIMWGSWAVLLAATVLTWVTIFGWRFRRALPDQAPLGLLRSIQAGEKPPAWAKNGWSSFTFTVVLVSLTGTAVLAIVLLWILGDWNEYSDPLWLALKSILAAWWVSVIATVLARVAIFSRQKRKLKDDPGGPANLDKE